MFYPHGAIYNLPAKYTGSSLVIFSNILLIVAWRSVVSGNLPQSRRLDWQI
jgi:hypothetical protein